MTNFSNSRFRLIFSGYFSISLLFLGCANMQQPMGGPKDITPPKVVKETPSNLTRNFSASKIEIQFDEFIKLKNESSEISISPAIDKMPIFKAQKKILDLKLEQAFEKNTTYTINFGKAIVDVNEGNILQNYSYVFSTGDHIDSLSISGNVKSTITTVPLKDVTVFVLPIGQDSLFGKKKANIFTSTDSAGNFILKNLRENTYRIYALKKPAAGGDRIFNPNTDEIGFLKDSIVLKKNIKDIKLNVFKETPSSLRNLADKIEADGRILLVFNKPVAELKIVYPVSLDEKKIVEFSAKKDSAFVWLPELTFDSLKIQASDQAKSAITVTINRNKKDTYTRAILVSDNLISNQKLKPRADLVLSLSSPMAEFDVSKMSLLQDSVPVKGFSLVKDSNSLRKVMVKFAWRPNKTYSLKLADSSFTDIFKTKSKTYSRKFTLDSDDNYGNLSIVAAVPDTTKNYLVQWLNEKQISVRTDIISTNTAIKYQTYPTGKYTVRVVYDANKNGEWDTGNVRQKLQPEIIWNYEKVITLRANWDVEEKIAIPADQ